MGLGDFLQEGGAAGIGGPINRGVDIRASQVEEDLKEFDKLVEEGGEKLDIGLANAEKKKEIKDKLMQRLKTTNAGLVLSEIDNYFDKAFDKPELVKVEPEDLNNIEKKLMFSVANLVDNSRDYTKVTRGKTDEDITPFIGKLTGADPTRYEIAEEYARRTGMKVEDVLKMSNFQGIETGIPTGGTPPNIKVTGRAGVLETDDKFGSSTDYNIKRNLNDPAYTYDVYDDKGTFLRRQTAFESSGERQYVLRENMGTLDNVNTINNQVDDVMFSNFGVFQQVDPLTGQITISSGESPKEKFSFAASQHAQRRAKEHAIGLFNRYGKVTVDQISSVANSAYEDFWAVFERKNIETGNVINNLHLYNNIGDDIIKYGNDQEVENPYKDTKSLSDRKIQFYKDLKKNEGEGVANTFKLFSNQITEVESVDGFVPRNKGSLLVYGKSNDPTTKFMFQVFQMDNDLFRVYFNDGSVLDGTRAQLARYL